MSNEETGGHQRRASDVDLAIVREAMRYQGEAIGRIETHVISVESKIDALHDEGLPRRVENLEKIIAWVTRVIVGVVILALLALVVTNGKVGTP